MASNMRPAGVDLSNWHIQPFSAWAFHHVDELVAVDRIEHDPSHRRTLVPALGEFTPPRVTGRSAAIDWVDFLRKTATDALVILHGERIVYEFYDHGMDEATLHILMSASKSVTGLVAGILQHRGTLDPEQTVISVLPELAGSPYQGATIRHLLDMRTGVQLDARSAADYAGATGWAHVSPGGSSDLKTFFDQLEGAPGPHGGPFTYVSANMDLLGWLLERITGRRFADLASELLWKPMRGQQHALVTTDRAGLARCTGGVCATARDFASVGLMMVGGTRTRSSIIPPAFLQDVIERGDAEAWKNGEFAPAFGDLPMHYRSGWYVINQPPLTLFAMGIHGQHLFIDPAHEIVLAKFSSQAARIDPEAMSLTRAAFVATRRLLVGA